MFCSKDYKYTFLGIVMQKFGEEGRVKKIGKVFGFIVTLILFSLGLFIIFSLTKKMPLGWGYIHFLIIAIIIIFIGFILKKYLAS